MANRRHLEVLEQGIYEWNTWRRNHPKIRPDLSHVNHIEADFCGANLSEADLRETNLSSANFFRADLSKADLSGSNLTGVMLLETNLTEANLTNCTIYGLSAWNVQLEGAKQFNLVITPSWEPLITVD